MALSIDMRDIGGKIYVHDYSMILMKGCDDY